MQMRTGVNHQVDYESNSDNNNSQQKRRTRQHYSDNLQLQTFNSMNNRSSPFSLNINQTQNNMRPRGNYSAVEEDDMTLSYHNDATSPVGRQENLRNVPNNL